VAVVESIVGHYRLYEEIGRGGMGVVYKAQDLQLDRTVALKFLPTALRLNDTATRRFREEARIASGLDHPNICTIHDIGETEDGRLYVVMPCYDGETMRERLQRGEMAFAEVTNILRQVVSGLAKAHENGIIHRDLNPSNIMITADGIVKILDFGLAKLSGSERVTQEGKTVGTIPYMPPEQLQDEDVDERADLWAAGVLLFEMMTGKLPFQGDHPPAVMYAIINEPTPDPRTLRPECPDELVALCERCLEKDRTRRPSSAREILTSLASGEMPRQPRGTRRFLRLQWKRLALVAGIVAIAAVGTWLVSRHLFAPAQLPIRIAVLPFASSGGDSVSADWPQVVQSLLVEGLTGLDRIGIIDPGTLQVMMENSQSGSAASGGTIDHITALAQQNIGLVVDGTIVRKQGRTILRAHLISPATREVQHSISRIIDSEAELPDAVAAIGQEIFAYIDVHLLTPETTPELRPWLEHRTRNMEAVRAFRQAGDYILSDIRGAEKLLARAVALDSTFIAPRVWLIAARLQDGHADDAWEQYHTLQGLQWRASPFELAMIGWSRAFLDNNVSEQAQFLSLALTYSPDNTILLVNLAGCFFQLGAYEEALKTITPAVRIRWKYPFTYPLAAECLLHLGKREDARKLLAETADLTTSLVHVPSLQSVIAFQEGDTAEVRACNERALRRARDNGYSSGYAYADLGDVWLEYSSSEQAVEYFTKALAVEPANEAYRTRLVETLMKIGRTEEAENVRRSQVKP
jgi:tetratricopeptide (TPR) repeat protein